MSRNTIVLADNFPIVREGLRALFNNQRDFEIIAEVDNGDDLVTLFNQVKPNLLIIEIGISGPSTRQIFQQIRRYSPETKLVVLSANKEEHYAAPMLQAGANGYIHKSLTATEILAAVRNVIQGDLFISGELAKRLAVRSLTKGKYRSAPLSQREEEILVELARGYRVGVIAQRLHLSPKTVSTHKTRIFQKLGIDNTFELVRYAIEQDLL